MWAQAERARASTTGRRTPGNAGAALLEAVTANVATQAGGELGVVVALGDGAGFGAGVFEAVGDDFVAVLEDVGVLGVLVAVGLEEGAQGFDVFDVHGAVEARDEGAFAEDALVLRRDGVGQHAGLVRRTVVCRGDTQAVGGDVGRRRGGVLGDRAIGRGLRR